VDRLDAVGDCADRHTTARRSIVSRVETARTARTHRQAAANVSRRQLGIDIAREFPKPMTDEVVQAADAVITMGCGDACPIYPGKRYEDWQVDDPSEADLDGVRRIRDDIGERVRRLLADVGEPRAPT
jgi:arsenate reductase (thioredoxin)